MNPSEPVLLNEATVRIGWVDAATMRPPASPPPSWNELHECPRHVHPEPGAARQLGGATRDAAVAVRLGRQLGGHFPQAVCAQARALAERRVRARFLVRHQPQRPVRQRRAERQERRPHGAHFCQRHARIPEAARAPHQRPRHPARRRTPRHARQLPARDGCRGVQPVLPGLGRIGQPLRGPVRHGVGHHARLHRLCRHGAGHAGHRGPRHCRGAGGHRHRPVCRHSGRGGLQPLCARHRPRGHPPGDLHRGVLQHPAAQPGRAPGPRPRATEPRKEPYMPTMASRVAVAAVP
jgi:hypothetical protein